MSTLLAVAHGSKDERAQQVVERLLRTATALRPGLHATPAFVDNASPSIRAALLELAGAGEREVTVVPLLLTSASHSKNDVAASVLAARRAHPQLRIGYGRPLGPHPVLVELLAQRLAEAGALAGDPVVLVAAGSLDPDANAQVAATARMLWEGRQFACVEAAFASTTRPSARQVVERLGRLGHDRVALARYFLGPGRLPDAVGESAAFVGVDLVVSEPLGVSEQLARLVLERYDEARAGDIRMNCDACLYRIALPGRAAQVGAPQWPHTHPDDPTPGGQR